MAYADTAFATTLYGIEYLTTACDRDGDGTLDAASFAEWLEVASDVIDGYILGRYSLPLATPPRTLKKLCVDIAVYEAAATAEVATKRHRERHEAAIKYLEQVAIGKIKLETSTDATTANAAQSAQVVTKTTVIDLVSNDDRQFQRDRLKGIL